MKKFFTPNQSGFSLVEILIATGMAGGLALGLAKMTENAAQNTKQIEAKTENINLKGLVQTNLAQSDSCNNTFGPLITPSNMAHLKQNKRRDVALTSIKNKTGQDLYTVSSSANIAPLTISSMTLTNYDDAEGTADLMIYSTFKRTRMIDQAVKPIKIPISFNIDSTVPGNPTLTSCSSSAITKEWSSVGNTGTVDGVDYFGTADNRPINIRVFNIPSGRIDNNSSTTFFGFESGRYYDPTSTASMNTGYGAGTLSQITTGQQNTGLGYNALKKASTAGSNTSVGSYSMASEIVTGVANTCVGTSCMGALTTGNYNVAMGGRALEGTFADKMTGNHNIALGYGAGSFMSSGSNNIVIGEGAAAAIKTGSNNIFIGKAASTATDTSNMLHIETTTSTTPLIGGNFTARTLSFNDKVGIGRIPGSTMLPYGDPADPLSKLIVGNPPAYDRALVDIFDANPTASRIKGLRAEVRQGNDWTYAIHGFASSTSGVTGNAVGVKGAAAGATAAGSGRAYGGHFHASNATDGYNYGVLTFLDGNSRGAALWASATVGVVGTGTDGLAGLNQKWAGVFYGDNYHQGNLHQIGTVNVTGNTVQVGEIKATVFTATSDERLKKNVKPLENSLSKILKVQGVSYDWKNESMKDPQIGVIAQDLEKVFPEVVLFDKTDKKKMRSVNYSAMVAPLIEAVKELYAMIMKLVSSDEKQNLEIEKLKAENSKLQVALAAQQESFEQRLKALEKASAK